MQGSTQEYRRNYTGLLADVAQARELVDDPRFELQIFAWSNLDARFVPNTLSQKLVHKPLGFLVRSSFVLSMVYGHIENLGLSMLAIYIPKLGDLWH